MSDVKNINWVALENCPEGQLVKANETDAGFDLKIAETTWIKPVSELAYSWEDVGLRDEIQLETPELFKPENSYSLFANQEGLRTKNKVIVEFTPKSRLKVIESLTSVGAVNISNHEDNSLFVDFFEELPILQKIKGVTKVEETVVLQRKKYKPTLIPTGIKVNPQELMWMALVFRSSMTKYGVHMPHSLGVIDFKLR